MAYISPDMYVGMEIKCNKYIDEIVQFISEKRGVTYQNSLHGKMLEGSELMGQLRICIRGIQEDSPELEKYKILLLRLEETVLRLKEYCELFGMVEV